MTTLFQNRSLRRRDLLIAATALAGSAVTGCSSNFHDVLQPPTPGEIPVEFADRAVWPGDKAYFAVTAMRERHLVGMTTVAEAAGTFVSGWVPVLVDLAGPITHAVVTDDSGAWVTKVVKPASGLDRKKPAATALTTLVEGPAVIDDEYAYLCVGVVLWDSPQQEPVMKGKSLDTLGHLVVLKLRLSDGAVVASRTVSDRFAQGPFAGRVHLSFTADRSSLILAGGRYGSEARDKGAGWVGLRLRCSDLEIEYDAHALHGTDLAKSVTPAGQGLSFSYALGEPPEVISLLTEQRYRHASFAVGLLGDEEAVVIGDWVYLLEDRGRAGRQDLHRYVVNMTTGERTDMPDADPDSPVWPSVFTDRSFLLDADLPYRLAVWPLGAAEPQATWPSSDSLTVESVATLGEHFYAQGRQDGKSVLKVLPFDSTTPVATIEYQKGLFDKVTAVTRWGITSHQGFIPATSWLE